MNYAIDIPRWISAKELAERAGVGRTTLYRFRNGDETVTEEIRAAITNTLEEMIEEKRLTAQTAA